MKLTDSVIKEWSEEYKTTNSLPSKKVPCTSCEAEVTMFSVNLHNRVSKFGGIENLLTTFKCRSCSTSPKPTVVKVIKKKMEKEVKQEDIKTHIYIPKPPTVINLLENPEEAAKLTYTECMRPDIFLDNNRSCDFCSLINICSCPIKCHSSDVREKRYSNISRKK